MNQKQKDDLQTKKFAKIRNRKYLIIGVVVFFIILFIALVVFLSWPRQGTEMTENNSGTTTAYGVEIENKCLTQLQDFIKNYGADYSKCLVDFSFNEEYCGGFDPDTQGLSDVNLIVILDSSGSMAEEVNSQKKIDIAKNVISDFMAKIPKGVKTGLIVYGHKGSNSVADKDLSCRGIEEVIKLSDNNSSNIISAMDSFNAKGWTPIAGSLDFARDILKNKVTDNKNYLILVSDGAESCDGNPIKSAQDLRSGVPGIKLNIIGFSTDYATRSFLEKIAIWGGGSYLSTDNSLAIAKAFNDQLLLIKKDCLTTTIFKAFSMNDSNNINNLDCWLDAYNKESEDYKINVSRRVIGPECSLEVSDALKVRHTEAWNKKQELEDKNRAIYEKIEADLKSKLKELNSIKN